MLSKMEAIKKRYLKEAAFTVVGTIPTVLLFLLLYSQKPAFIWQDDYQSVLLAGMIDAARSWMSGEIPLISPYSWNGGALAGEYQYGVFSIFICLTTITALILNLSLTQTALFISLTHLIVLAAGVFRLARSRNLPIHLATFAAMIASLSGWILLKGAINWVSALTSFAWVGWAWWMLEKSVGKDRQNYHFIISGFFLYLILTAGAPFTVLMIALVTAWIGLKAIVSNRLLSPIKSFYLLWPLVAAWFLGLALASPALLMLIEYSRETLRGEIGYSYFWQKGWAVPIAALPALIFPASKVFWINAAHKEELHISFELCCGIVPVVALVFVLIRYGAEFIKKCKWELGLFLTTLTLSLLPSIGSFRWSFRWLSLVHLVLGLVAAEAINTACSRNEDLSTLSNRLRASFGIWSLAILAITLPITVLDNKSEFTNSLAIYYILIGVGWVALEVCLPLKSIVRRWIPAAVTFFSLLAFYIPIIETPNWIVWNFRETIRKPAPLDEKIRYFSIYDYVDMFNPPLFQEEGFGTLIRPGSSSLYAGVEMINGYSPLSPSGINKVLHLGPVHGYLRREDQKEVLRVEVGSDGMLQLLAVDGLFLPVRFGLDMPDLIKKGWSIIHSSPEGAIFHRTSPSPRVRALEKVEYLASEKEIIKRILSRMEGRVPLLLLSEGSSTGEKTFAQAKVTLLEDTRLSAIADVDNTSSTSPAMIVFSRAWYPGYRATFNGQELPIKVLNLVVPAVEIPAGSKGAVVLEYYPQSFAIGLKLASAAFVVSLILMIGLFWKSLKEQKNSP
ncbi:MAG: hypothetical protein JNN15_07400, partial [Blastocatellia bacterium]|nr:hypothetical protein [Blastocatellia bacterium]